MTTYEIPTKPYSEEFDISLSGTTYHLILTWCPPNASWIMAVEDAQRNPLISGVPLITGIDLLEQFGYLGIGGFMIVQSDFNPNLVPDYGSMGSTGHLFYVVTS